MEMNGAEYSFITFRQYFYSFMPIKISVFGLTESTIGFRYIHSIYNIYLVEYEQSAQSADDCIDRMAYTVLSSSSFIFSLTATAFV